MTIEKWQTDEQVAVYVPGQFASTPGMEFVEKKQVTAGKSGATWEIDNKAVLEGEKGQTLAGVSATATSPQL
ncbi:hypothetical protein [Kutzneria sp. 744]|uniref:hypothetical protein n=1 Tax=Kutzneria sp. (strain 744) TaxID=345341 RepID=UPI0003EEB2CA|nr:hypothetical protein [Kutzneria sp. 744]EWM10245.1 hypothetical protein KUTG_00549 [Kutzneria sp. 744]